MSAITIRLLVVCCLIVVCTGCPPRPPSQEEQLRATTSRWITIESARADGGSRVIRGDDVDAVAAQVPVLSRIVPERGESLTLVHENTSQADVSVCGTSPEYLELLQDRARANVLSGRFFEADDFREAASVIVLSESLASKLVSDSNPVGSAITVGEKEFTVIGVVADGGGDSSGQITYDAYVPLPTLQTIPHELESPAGLDRIRCKVESLDQVAPVTEIIERIMSRRTNDEPLRVR